MRRGLANSSAVARVGGSNQAHRASLTLAPLPNAQIIMLSVVALALLESVHAFSAPAMRMQTRSSAVTMFEEGDIGVLPPLGTHRT